MNHYRNLKNICNLVEVFKRDPDMLHIIDNFLADSIDYILAFGEYYSLPTIMMFGGKNYELPSLFSVKRAAKEGNEYLLDLYNRVRGSLSFQDAISDTRFYAVQSIKNNILTGDEATDKYAKDNYAVFRKTNYFIHSLVTTGKINDDNESRDAVRLLLYQRQYDTCREIAENIDRQIPEDIENIEEELISILYRNPILREDEIPLYVAMYSYVTQTKTTLYDLKEYYEDRTHEIIEEIKQRDYISGLKNKSPEECLTMDDIDFMSGTEFEKLIASMFSKIGYMTKMTKGSGDQGVDIIAKKGNATIVIQTKRYSRSISNAAIQQVVAGRDYYNADKCMVITSNYFTESAKELADANNVTLWDRDDLQKKIEGHYFG